MEVPLSFSNGPEMSSTSLTDADLPFMDLANREFWTGCREGRLLLRRCTECHKVHWYPRPLCPYCMGTTEWEPASGRGEIYSLSIDRTGAQPLAVAYVTLAEGVKMLTNIVDCDVDTLRIGHPVRVVFRSGPDGTVLPMFTAA